jgi:hypothetical protein
MNKRSGISGICPIFQTQDEGYYAQIGVSAFVARPALIRVMLFWGP